MLQNSKVLSSREDWKDKATDRGEQLREARKAKKRYKEVIDKLKNDVNQLKEELGVKKTEKANNSF